jgi:hypothetical protein
MKCNAHICCLYFITSNPGLLQLAHIVSEPGTPGGCGEGGGSPPAVWIVIAVYICSL